MKCMGGEAEHNELHLNRLKWTSLNKAGPGQGPAGRERVPSKLRGPDLPRSTRNPREPGKRSGPWLVPDSPEKNQTHAFHSSPSHYRQITTATSINSLIGSVKQAATSGGGTSALNSKRRPPRCLNQRTRSTLKVSIIMQVEKTMGKYQAKTIQSLHTSALGLWVCFAISLRSILAGLIMRAAVIPQDKFPQKRKP